MNQVFYFLAALSLAISFGVSACSDRAKSTGSKKTVENTAAPLSVYVVNYPLSYFADRIGGPHVRSTLPAPADSDPAVWAPGVETISAYQEADLILLNGASYAKWVPRVSLPASRMVDTSAAFADTYIPIDGRTSHRHGASGEHRHGDTAFTTWLDPSQAIVQAQSVRDALVRLRPGAAADFKQRFAALETDLRELDDGFATLFASAGSPPIVFSHPVYQYFMRRYTIEGYAVHWEPESVPNAEQWRELERLLVIHPARTMVWEADPDPATVAELKMRGLHSIVFDPCANVPAEGDYLTVMQANLHRLAQL